MSAQVINHIASFTPTSAIDVVGIFDQNYNQVFPRARPIKATVNPSAKLMEHPLETGATTIDHRIILPIEIELSMILQAADYRDAYTQITQLFENGTLLIVQTRASTYTNQLIMSLPHDEDPELYNTLLVSLKLREVQFVVSSFEPVPRNPNNGSTQRRGNIESSPSTPSQEAESSLLYRTFF